MSKTGTLQRRHLSLFDATGIGVGAIVGGGILALAGTAFAMTGPGAWLAFLLNGLIAFITALSFAELSTAFPQSGGTYLFAKRVLSVGAAFSVGWVVWFASMVAAALYAIGFATFVLDGLSALWLRCPYWMTGTSGVVVTALLSTLMCTWWLSRLSGTGSNGINVIKVLVFAVLILGGMIAWFRDNPPVIERMTPLLPGGAVGLITAMGYTFVALQGFDLVAAVAGEVREPRRVLPRALLMSLGIALAIYIPMMILIPLAGLPGGESLGTLVAAHSDTVVALGARVFIGRIGFWLVIVVGILSMLSALMANLFAATRIAQAMSQDRTLPRALEGVSQRTGTPRAALWCTGILVCLVLLCVRDVSRAGAAASLIFLITFALAHVICLLARKRKPNHSGYKLPMWPLLPILGLIACFCLAVFQGFIVPAAGLITGTWLVTGFFCYLWLFGRRARVYDAASESADPDLLELRGRSPLVLVPIANPANAGTTALLAACIAPPRVGRILLLNVARMPGTEDPQDDTDLQTTADVIYQSMSAAMRERVRVEGLATLARDPWIEIERVARTHRCASVLLGMTNLADDEVRMGLETLVGRLGGNVVIFRSPPGWHPRSVRRVLVPIGGRIVHNALRARLLQGLYRRVDGELEVCYLSVVPAGTSEQECQRIRRLWSSLVTDESRARSHVDTIQCDDVPAAIGEAAKNVDLLVLGLNRADPRRHVFGTLTTRVVQAVDCAVMVIGQRG